MATTDPKHIVQRFNSEVIEAGNAESFAALMAPDFVNRTAPPGAPNGPDSMWSMLVGQLRPALPDLKVTIHDQIAEGDRVTTRKTISGTFSAALMGVAPTGQELRIEVIDIVRVRGGQYAEHWGINTLATALAAARGTGV